VDPVVTITSVMHGYSYYFFFSIPALSALKILGHINGPYVACARALKS
jgi:hypothetical protein